MHCDTIQSGKDESALRKPKRPFIIVGEIGQREYHAAISVHFVEVIVAAAAAAAAKLRLILENSIQFSFLRHKIWCTLLSTISKSD